MRVKLDENPVSNLKGYVFAMLVGKVLHTFLCLNKLILQIIKHIFMISKEVINCFDIGRACYILENIGWFLTKETSYGETLVLECIEVL